MSGAVDDARPPSRDGAASRRISVFVIDDSAVVRQTLVQLLEAEPDMMVAGVAADPLIAERKLRHLQPDVLLLDLHMPRMDGLTFLHRIMRSRPVPVVVCSSYATSGSELALRALESGAVSIVAKPRVGTRQFLEDSRVLICDEIRAAATACRRRVPPRPPEAAEDADVVLAPVTGVAAPGAEPVIAVGASTGGTEALRVFLGELPEDAPGVVVVQHMPAGFTLAFARRLDRLSAMRVREARNLDRVERGVVLIAPGDRHMVTHRGARGCYVELRDGPLVRRHRPSVDVLFRSVAAQLGRAAVGVLLTGMGDDGARGLLELREAGARTIVQDEATCVVFGMPHEAIRRGAAERVLPLRSIARQALAMLQR